MRIVLAILLLLSIKAEVLGNIYVKDLHKKCLSKHQSCLWDCAGTYSRDEAGNLTRDAIVCAEMCKDDYILCEKALDRLKELSDKVPLEEEYKDNYIPDMPRQPRVFP